MDAFYDDVRQDYQDYEDTDDGLLLLKVFYRAAQYGIPAPYDACLALKQILDRYDSGECRTLDEAFNVARPPHWKQPPIMEKNRVGFGPGGAFTKAGWLWHRAESLRREGMSIGGDLFAILAEEFNVSESRARDWYYEVSNNLKNVD